MILNCGHSASLDLDRPAIVGILNVTPDSFSDGQAHADVGRAAAHAERMVAEGADVIDIGGESTRPGAARVAIEQQIQRVVPVIERLRHAVDVPLSVDTTRTDVARAAIDAGAAIINDVSAGRDDENMFALAADRGVPIVLMHMLGEPATMQDEPRYVDVVEEVASFLTARVEAAIAAGVPRDQIVIDPGIGFGKTTAHNLALLARLDRLVDSGRPVMIGTSRKRFLGELAHESDPAKRDAATAATSALAVASGVQLLRVHDVRVNRHAADLARAIRDALS